MGEPVLAVAQGGSVDVGFAVPLAECCGWCSAGSWWLYRLNQALQRFPALFIIPALHATWQVCSVTSGAIFFEELEGLHNGRQLCFVAGFVVTISGIFLLAPKDGEGRPERASEAELGDLE